MAAFTKFYQFVQDLGDGVHDLNVDTIAIYLSDSAPNVSTNKVKANVPEIATGNGYAGPINIHNAYSQTGGVGTMTGDASETITASGGSIATFRYIVLYNSSKAGGPLIAYWDYGSEVTLASGNTFTVNFDPAILTIQ